MNQHHFHILLFSILLLACKSDQQNASQVLHEKQDSIEVPSAIISMKDLDSISLFKVIENDSKEKYAEIRIPTNEEIDEMVEVKISQTKGDFVVTSLDTMSLKKWFDVSHFRSLFFYEEQSPIGQRLNLIFVEYVTTPISSYIALKYPYAKPSNFTYATNFSQLENDDSYSASKDVPPSLGKYTNDLENFTFFTDKYKTSILGLLTTEKSSNIISFAEDKTPVELYKGKGDNYIISIQPLPIFINKQPILLAEMGHPDFDEIKEVVLVYYRKKYVQNPGYQINIE